MSVTAVVFDVGETLVDETRLWEQVADNLSIPRFTLMGIVAGLIARGDDHRHVWELIGSDPVPADFTPDDFYSDALPCLERLHAGGFLTGAAGNGPASTEEIIRPYVSVVGSAGTWDVEKPATEFFERLIVACNRPPSEIAYVGDRVDNDIAPALAAGLVAVHLLRGPWAYLQRPPPEAIRITTLDELPHALP